MNANAGTPNAGGVFDRDEAAAMLASVENRASVAKEKDVRNWAITAALIGILMGLFIALSSISPFVMVGYAVLLLAVILWQRRNANATPRGVSSLYTWGIVGSSAMVVVVIFVLGVIFGGFDNTPIWAGLLGGLAVAAPLLGISAVILRRGV